MVGAAAGRALSRRLRGKRAACMAGVRRCRYINDPLLNIGNALRLPASVGSTACDENDAPLPRHPMAAAREGLVLTKPDLKGAKSGMRAGQISSLSRYSFRMPASCVSQDPGGGGNVG